MKYFILFLLLTGCGNYKAKYKNGQYSKCYSIESDKYSNAVNFVFDHDGYAIYIGVAGSLKNTLFGSPNRVRYLEEDFFDIYQRVNCPKIDELRYNQYMHDELKDLGILEQIKVALNETRKRQSAQRKKK